MESLMLAVGIVIGIAIGYLLLKTVLQKKYIERETFDILQKELSDLKVDSAGRLSKDELSNNYIGKELFDRVNSDRIQVETENVVLRSRELELTSLVEQKLSREEVSLSYVPKEAYDLLNRSNEATRKELAEKNEELLSISTHLTALKSQHEHLEERIATFKTDQESLRTQAEEHFKNIASTLLDEKRVSFVATNKTELTSILDPLKQDLTNFKDKIEATRKEDIADLTSLKGEIAVLGKLNVQLSEDAKGLAHALKSDVKMQGNWGEDRLNMILETEGLQKYIDFTREETYRDDEQERNRRPDYILKLPNDKHLIIDSKVSLTAYTNYHNAESPQEKSEFLKLHLKSITDHIQLLSDKQYQSLAGLTTPDYVFMFVAVESALTLAMNQKSDIFEYALSKKIVLITASTLVATLKVVKLLWQQENQVKNVEEIFKQCGSLYDKFVSFLEDMEKIDTGLQNATKAYNNAMNSLSTGARKGATIIGKIEHIRKLEAKTNKRIPSKLLTAVEMLGDDDDTIVLEQDNSEEKTADSIDTII